MRVFLSIQSQYVPDFDRTRIIMRIATFQYQGRTQVGLVNAEQTQVTVLNLSQIGRAHV